MCNGGRKPGPISPNPKVEPYLAIDPINPAHLIGLWQQDRWSTTGSNGLLTGVSWDGGRTWTRSFAHLSRCAGGNLSNGGGYDAAPATLGNPAPVWRPHPSQGSCNCPLRRRLQQEPGQH